MTEHPYDGENIFDPGSRNDVAIRCGILHVGSYNVMYSQRGNEFSLLPRWPDNLLAFTLHVTLLSDPEKDMKIVKQAPNYVIPELPIIYAIVIEMKRTVHLLHENAHVGHFPEVNLIGMYWD